MNLNDTQQRLRWGIIVGLVILAFFFLILDNAGRADTVLAFLRSPLSDVLGWTAARTDAFADVFAGPRDLQAARARVAELESQLAELERENAELQEFRNQNQLYVELFNRAAEAPELERLQANVIGRDTSPVFHSIIIDKGSDDGVFVGMPVEAARGLVGQVYRTSPHSAQVLLVSDNISSISARLSSSRALGVVHGGGLGGSLTLDWVDLEAVIQVGDIVLTSGLNGEFPQDMVIGRVIEVQRSEAELFQRAVLQPAVDFETLEVVFVITGFEPIDTNIFDTPPETLPARP
ncbi:MAG: rod shape-determining protein MreC [Anaerolineales bacterium]|nr:rod shape-determining protein MreC [Anaerolineales bacterium]